MLQHHICSNLHRQISIFKDPEFAESKAVLDLVKVKKRAMSLTRADEEEMWQNGAFGSANPLQLLHTVIYHIGLPCSLRASQEHRDLEFGKFAKSFDVIKIQVFPIYKKYTALITLCVFFR